MPRFGIDCYYLVRERETKRERRAARASGIGRCGGRATSNTPRCGKWPTLNFFSNKTQTKSVELIKKTQNGPQIRFGRYPMATYRRLKVSE